MREGRVYLVGAGSGDPKLITLKAIELIKRCDVIIYDRLANDELLKYTPPRCKKIYVGKAAGSHYMSQEEINRLIINEAKAGNDVVRLKGGDPFVFGRGGEEIIALTAENIQHSVVSGISSAIAVPSAAGIPVTHRGVSGSFTVVTGHMATDSGVGEDYSVLAKIKGTIVFLMGLGSLKNIVCGLINNGKDAATPVAVISEGTTKNQLTVRGSLEDIVDKVINSKIKSPAIIVIGNVCSLDFSDSIKKSLDGVRIGLTGTENFNKKLKGILEEVGADVKEIAHLEVTPINKAQFGKVMEEIREYSWIVFTSANGVRIFFWQLFEFGGDIRCVGGIRFAVIGSGTFDELKEYGIKADLMPKEYTAEALSQLLATSVGNNEKILIARAEGGSVELLKHLSGHKVRDMHIYDVIGDDTEDDDEAFDFIVFGSASAVKNYFQVQKKSLGSATAVAIGNVTAKEIDALGIKKYIVSKEFNAEGIAEKIKEEVKKQTKFL